MIIDNARSGYTAQQLLDSHDDGLEPEMLWSWPEIVAKYGPDFELDFHDRLKVWGHNDDGATLHCPGEVLGWLGW